MKPGDTVRVADPSSPFCGRSGPVVSVEPGLKYPVYVDLPIVLGGRILSDKLTPFKECQLVPPGHNIPEQFSFDRYCEAQEYDPWPKDTVIRRR